VRLGAATCGLALWTDGWFLLDVLIVIFTVAETWVMPLTFNVLLLTSGGETVDLSILRVLRLGKVMRLAKVMHVIPEIYVVVTEAARALRSAFATILALLLVTYMFTVIFIQVAPGFKLDDERLFRGLLHSMSVLFLNSVLPDNVDIVSALTREAWYLGVLFTLFLCLTSILGMNMLLGLVCELMISGTKSCTEQADYDRMATTMRDVFRSCLPNPEGVVTVHAILDLLELPETIRLFRSVGVDGQAIADDAPVIFADLDECPLNCEGFLEMVWQYRPSVAATVRSISGFRGMAHEKFSALEDKLCEIDFRLRHTPNYNSMCMLSQ